MSNFQINGTINYNSSTGEYTISTTDSNTETNSYTFQLTPTNYYYNKSTSGSTSCPTSIFGNLIWSFNNGSYVTNSTGPIVNSLLINNNNTFGSPNSSSCSNLCYLYTNNSFLYTNLYNYMSCTNSFEYIIIAENNSIYSSSTNSQTFYYNMSTSIPLNTIPSCNNYSNISVETSDLVSGSTYNTTYQFYTSVPNSSSDSSWVVQIIISNLYNSSINQLSVSGFTINLSNSPTTNTYMIGALAFLSNLSYGINVNTFYNNSTNQNVLTNTQIVIGSISPLILIYSYNQNSTSN